MFEKPKGVGNIFKASLLQDILGCYVIGFGLLRNQTVRGNEL